MSYCDFNNAFKNVNDKFLETFDGITSEDLSFNDVNSENLFFDDQNGKNRIQSNITRSEENLNGTSIQYLKNNSCNSNKNINTNKNINSNKNINLNNNKLTHRECIHLYLNPIDNKNPNYQLAQKHITICTLCQNEINKKVQESFETVNLDNIPVNTPVNTPTNTPVNTLVNRSSVIQDVNASNRTFTNQSNVNTENKVVSLSMSELEVLLKNITEKTSNNDKYENFSRMIQKLDDNERNKPLCIELNFMNIAICLLIILLLIDIVLRLKK